MKKIILKIIVLLVTVGIIYNGYEMVKELKFPNNVSEVNTKEIINKDKSIAIMVQDSETDNWHEATDRNSWPSPTTHGFVGAECTDSDGAEIDYTNILKFDLTTYHATIDTKNSIYCTLYFAKGRPLLQALNETKGSALNLSIPVDGMYRYKGTASQVNNNYICFGTSDKTECLKTPDTYMYRIIGITSEERTENEGKDIMWKKDQLKIIKATPSAKEQSWGSSDEDSSPWDSSKVKTDLTTWYNTNIKNKQPNGIYWDSIVTEQKWYNADQKSNPTTTEPTGSQSAKSKVSLMYGTDYYNAGTQDKNNWLFIANGWIGNTSSDEWTMSREGYISDYGNGHYYAWYVYKDGDLHHDYVNEPRAVRPVLYLQSEINLTGTGKSDDPFRITTKNNA